MRRSFLLTLVTAVASAHFTSAALTILNATDASKVPLVAAAGTRLTNKAEGASVDFNGQIFAVNGDALLNLGTGEIALKGPGAPSDPKGPPSQLASSRWLKNGDLIAADAFNKTVYLVPGPGSGYKDAENSTAGPYDPLILVRDTAFMQPNDMALDDCHRFVYFSGMNYTSTTLPGQHGELSWYDLKNRPNKIRTVSKSVLKAANVHRTNGIEISRCQKTGKQYLYLTSARNTKDVVDEIKIVRFTLNPKTGEPHSPKTVLDILPRLKAEGLDLTTAGVDPDGVRADTLGNLYITLNAGRAVLRWNPHTNVIAYIGLETVFFPSNLEFGGKCGNELYVVGRCQDGKTSCIDRIVFPKLKGITGRAWASLNDGRKLVGGVHKRGRKNRARRGINY